MATVLTPTRANQPKTFLTAVAAAILAFDSMRALAYRASVAVASRHFLEGRRIPEEVRARRRGLLVLVLGFSIWAAILIAGLVGMSRGFGPG